MGQWTEQSAVDAMGASLPPTQLQGLFPLVDAACQEFPSFSYLDGAATGQMASPVSEAVRAFEETSRANIHRGIYPLAEEATERYEQARATVGKFLGGSADNIVFTHGATEALNMAALGWAAAQLQPGDLVVVSEANHHSNMVPWLMLQEKNGVEVAFAPVHGEGDRAGMLDEAAWEKLLGRRPKLVALPHTSNVTGFTEDAALRTQQAHEAGAVVVLDCAQSAAHMALDLAEWDVDFAAVSAHKMYGPFGIGALWAKPERLEEMAPLMGGGGMVGLVSAETGAFTLAPVPQRFEAGTPNISGAVGLAAACELLSRVDRAAEARRTAALVDKVVEAGNALPGARVLGAPLLGKRMALVSLFFDEIHPHDVAQVLGERGICARAGSHCAQPLHHRLGFPASVRVSFSLHSNASEVDLLLASLGDMTKGRL